MSWDILPKGNLEYFLQKLKSKFDLKVDKETGKGLFSGSYTDLTNKPTIPAAANNNTITIQLNGVTVESFTLNQATDETINIQVTKSSVGLGNVGNFKAVSTEASQGLTDTEKANARSNIGAGTSSTDQQVYQENTNTNTDYRVLLGVESNTTSYVYKSIGLRYNPGKDSVYTEKINDTILGDAIGYDVQNDSSASDLTNAYLQTGQTIKSYLNSNFVKFKKQAISSATNTISFNIGTPNNNNIINALLFIRVWLTPSGINMSGVVCWVSIRHSESAVGLAVIKSDSQNQFAISNCSYDANSTTLTVTTTLTTSYFAEIVYV